MAEEWVTSLAFGNKRKRILFAHTEENSSSFPHETQTPRAGLPEDTHAPPSLWCSPAPGGSGQASIGRGRQSSEPRGQRGWGGRPGVDESYRGTQGGEGRESKSLTQAGSPHGTLPWRRDTEALCVKGTCPRSPSMSWGVPRVQGTAGEEEPQVGRSPRLRPACRGAQGVRGCPRGRPGPRIQDRAESSLLATLPQGGQGTSFQSC